MDSSFLATCNVNRREWADAVKLMKKCSPWLQINGVGTSLHKGVGLQLNTVGEKVKLEAAVIVEASSCFTEDLLPLHGFLETAPLVKALRILKTDEVRCKIYATALQLSNDNSEAYYEIPISEIPHGKGIMPYMQNPFRYIGGTPVASFDNLKQAIGEVAYAAFPSSIGAGCDNILLDVRDSKLFLVATDTVRIVCRELELQEGKTVEETGLVSMLLGTEALKLAALYSKGKTNVRFDPENVELQCENVTFHLPWANAEGEFPRYMKIFPKENSHSAVVDYAKFKEALEAGAMISDKKKMSFTFKDEALFLEARNWDGTKYAAKLSYLGYNPPGFAKPMELAFNTGFVLEWLNSVGKDPGNVEMGFTSAVHPVIFTIEGNELLKYLLMPINI